jgi:hypothetical protein
MVHTRAAAAAETHSLLGGVSVEEGHGGDGGAAGAGAGGVAGSGGQRAPYSPAWLRGRSFATAGVTLGLLGIVFGMLSVATRGGLGIGLKSLDLSQPNLGAGLACDNAFTTPAEAGRYPSIPPGST